MWHFRETSHGFGNMFITIFLDLSFACFPVFAPEKLILNFNSAVICKRIGNTKTKEMFAIHLKRFNSLIHFDLFIYTFKAIKNKLICNLICYLPCYTCYLSGTSLNWLVWSLYKSYYSVDMISDCEIMTKIVLLI